MMLFAGWFFENLARGSGNHRIGGENQGGLDGVVDEGGVDVSGFGLGGEEDIFERGEGFGLVFGDRRRMDF